MVAYNIIGPVHVCLALLTKSSWNLVSHKQNVVLAIATYIVVDKNIHNNNNNNNNG